MRVVFVVVVLAVVGLAGCTQNVSDALEANEALNLNAKQLPGEKQIIAGRLHYEAGNFGLAEAEFRKATEFAPRSLRAWIGLAASYDQLKRFDLADRAYDQAVQIGGPRIEILNNRGYSYFLRGDYDRAEASFRHALRLEPENLVTQNNLELLRKARSG